MSAEIRINRKTGHVHCGLISITPQTTLNDLSSDFLTEEEKIVSVAGKKLPCVFSKTHVQNNGLKFELSLRFESCILVSVFIAITDPSIPTDTQEDFYKSLEPSKDLHERWLKKQIGERPTTHTRFSWGVVGVAQDKSDNIYIYLHNPNNTWAFGA